MADRNRILADFQACTGIEDIEECIAILEQTEWDLMTAVQNAMAEPSRGFDVPPPYSEAAQDCAAGSAIGGSSYASSYQADSGPSAFMVSGAHIGNAAVAEPRRELPVAEASSVSAGLTSRPSAIRPTPSRMLNFNIEYRDRSLPLLISDSDTVGRLKELIQAELDVPVSKQVLRGWLNSRQDGHIDDKDVLVDLRLPLVSTLYLLTPDLPAAAAAVQPSTGENPNILERLSQTFTLNIHYKDEDKRYNLNFPGSKTVQEVKGDVYSLIDVPVRYQVWVGWPEAAKDEAMTLAGCGIGWPCHELEVCRSVPMVEPSAGPVRISKREPVVEDTDEITGDDGMDVDGSEEEFGDAADTFNDDDDLFDIGGVRKPEPLMPENARDQTEALERFSAEFALRYGERHPVFYIGTLENAIQEALLCKAKDRKLLAIYLHHDSSILSNVFCQQVLCAEGVVNYLCNHFITWAWDLTSETNKSRLLTMCTQHFGSVAANTVRNFKPDELPLLLIISRTRSINEVMNVIRANIIVDELMTHLIQAVEVFREQQTAEISEEVQRDEREEMKRAQDAAYEESLAADRAKAETKRLEEEERQKLEQAEERKRQLEDQIRRKEEEEKEAIRVSVENQLPDEPPEGCRESVSKIRIRTPDGEVLTRRFYAKNSLQVLLNYITSCGYHVGDYKVLTTFPRRDLTQTTSTSTLEELKMFPQDTVILEAKDSE